MAGDQSTPTSARATDREAAKQREQLEASLVHLRSAVAKANAYLEDPGAVAEVIFIHINFVSQRIAGVEKVVNTINRRNRSDDQSLPEEAEQAADLVRDLQIKRAELLREEKERERLQQATLAAATQVASTSATVAAAVPLLVVKKPPLPPLPIPRFAGNVMDYNNFITVFNETIHKNDTLAPSQKLVYLQSYMDGEARKLIANILVNDTNYDLARETLRANYGQSTQTISILYDRLHGVQRCRNDPFSIRDTYNEIESIFQMLENAGVDINGDQYLFNEMMKKWPWALVRQLMRTPDIGMKEFRRELSKEIQLQLQLTQMAGYTQAQQQSQQRQKPYGGRPFKQRAGTNSYSNATNYNQGGATQTTLTTKPTAQNTIPQYFGRAKADSAATSSGEVPMPTAPSAHCPFCKERHHAENCEQYKTAKQRTDKILGKKCQKCFRDLHDGIPCINNFKCRYCPSYDHNRALCPIKYGEQSSQIMFTEEERNVAGLFMTLLVVAENAETGRTCEVRLLIDPACNRTALTEAAAKKLGISLKNRRKSVVRGMGDQPVEAVTDEATKIHLCGANGERTPVNVRLTAKIAQDVPVYSVQYFRKRYPAYADYGIPATGAGRPVDLIVGTDYLVRFLTLDNSVRVDDACQLLSTKFGWVIFAENPEPHVAKERGTLALFTRSEDVVQAMWDLDVVGMKAISQADAEYEERALNIFYESIRFVDGRYEVHWPWRNYPPNLSENYGLAMGRLRSLLKRLSEQPELLTAYGRIISDQLREGVLEDVPPDEIRTTNITHYIPHHAVVVMEKSTPVRVVTDAAAAVGGARSLNDNILKGNKWLNSTVGSLVRFRKQMNAVTADIRHAFHQISIAPSDRDAVRFIWVHDSTKPPTGSNIRILRFKRVAFGIVASPFLLYATIQYHLRNNPTKYTQTLCTEMYADNLLASLPLEVDMIDFYKTTKKLFAGMSMDMTKWKTNVLKLEEYIPGVDQIPEKEVSVLGMRWCTEEDDFGLKNPRIVQLQKLNVTKRTVLKTMASIYDPLGWVTPFVLQIRIFLRRLWLKKKSWDSALDPEDVEVWMELKKEIEEIGSIQTRRMYFSEEIDEEKYDYELHTFSDASAKAIGSVTYLRRNGDQPEIAFLMAKSRLAPTSKTSIPRLEFYALVMAVRVQNYLANELNLKRAIKRLIWSDSKCVLAWISSNKLLPVAIEKHLNEVRNSGVTEFRYVPTSFNPADIASRGMRLRELRKEEWFCGPGWLKADKSEWPSAAEIVCEQIEEFVPKALFIQGENAVPIPPPFFIDVKKYSSWKALLRRTAYCIAALNYCLKKKFIKTRTLIDYDAAKKLWLRWDQRCNGADEENVLRQVKHFKKVELSRDESGILRCKSRLTEARLPWETIEPAVLVKGSHITELIVMDIHQRNFHVGTAHTLATLRKHYWLVHGRREIFRIIHTKCLNCKFHDTKPLASPPEATLPRFRVTKSRPFQNIGIDTMGPFYVLSTESQNKTQVKRWILLTTCLVVRAIHLEILGGMDTQDILCAIKRLVARRGAPSLILSDNSKQFHLVDGCMQQIWRKFPHDEEGSRYLAENNIVWRFIPDYSPWMGGAYERLVQNTKQAFKKTYGEQCISEREFNTTIVEIEAIINNRPITYVDQSLETPLLTPNHFLQVTYPALSIDPDAVEKAKPLTRSILIQYWKDSEQHLDYFWQIWSHHYLLSLREIQSRSAQNKVEPKVGDVVLITHPILKRGFWKKAIIERLINSHDGRARSVQVRLASGTRMIRPFQKIVPLELMQTLVMGISVF